MSQFDYIDLIGEEQLFVHRWRILFSHDSVDILALSNSLDLYFVDSVCDHLIEEKTSCLEKFVDPEIDPQYYPHRIDLYFVRTDNVCEALELLCGNIQWMKAVVEKFKISENWKLIQSKSKQVAQNDAVKSLRKAMKLLNASYKSLDSQLAREEMPEFAKIFDVLDHYNMTVSLYLEN